MAYQALAKNMAANNRSGKARYQPVAAA